MTPRLLGLLAALFASAALAQVHVAVPVFPDPALFAPPVPAVVVQPAPPPPPAVSSQPPCGPRPVALHASGAWELRTVQQWVEGSTQQVWMDGACRRHHRNPWKQRCAPGQYVTVETPGHFEARQQWVWVDVAPRPRW